MRIVGKGSRLILTLFALLMAAVGCAKKGTDPPVPPAITEATAEDMAILGRAGAALFALDIQTASAFVPAGSPTVARPTKAYRDTSFNQGGLAYSGRGNFFTASDSLLSGYGPLAAKMIWQCLSLVGTSEGTRDTVSFDPNDYDSSLEARGLQAGQDTLTFAGGSDDSLFHRFRSFDGASFKIYFWGAAVSVQNVKVLKSAIAGGGPVIPVGGTIVFAVRANLLRSADRQDIQTANVEAVVRINYNGTNLVDMFVDTTFHFRWNMTTGEITRILT